MKIGDRVIIPMQSHPGRFESECLVAILSLDGPICGFLPTSEVIGGASMAAVVTAVGVYSVNVRLSGTFFATTGLASLSLTALTTAENQ